MRGPHIVIPTFDRPDLIRQSMEWLGAYPPCDDVHEWTLTVVCNGTEHEETHAAVETANLPALSTSLVCRPEPIGFARASNLGALEQPRARFYLFLNNDAFPQRSGWAEPMIAAMNADSSLMAVGPMGGHTVGDTLEPYGFEAPYRKAEHDGITRVDYVEGWCLLVRGDEFERVGGFREDRFFWAEDSDLARKLISLRSGGWVGVMWIPILHLGGATWKAYHVAPGDEQALIDVVGVTR